MKKCKFKFLIPGVCSALLLIYSCSSISRIARTYSEPSLPKEQVAFVYASSPQGWIMTIDGMSRHRINKLNGLSEFKRFWTGKNFLVYELKPGTHTALINVDLIWPASKNLPNPIHYTANFTKQFTVEAGHIYTFESDFDGTGNFNFVTGSTRGIITKFVDVDSLKNKDAYINEINKFLEARSR